MEPQSLSGEFNLAGGCGRSVWIVKTALCFDSRLPGALSPDGAPRPVPWPSEARWKGSSALRGGVL